MDHRFGSKFNRFKWTKKIVLIHGQRLFIKSFEWSKINYEWILHFTKRWSHLFDHVVSFQIGWYGFSSLPKMMIAYHFDWTYKSFTSLFHSHLITFHSANVIVIFYPITFTVAKSTKYSTMKVMTVKIQRKSY